MRLFTDRPATRWAVPIFAVVALAAGASLASVSASADPNLPDRTAAQLLVDVRGAGLHAGSGTVVQTSDLGLPELPGVTTGGSGSQPVTSLLGGSHTWRVWYAGPTKARVALVGSLGETDVIRNGQDAWVWDSAQKEAVHYTLPAEDHPAGPVPTALASQLPMTPDEAAAKALAAIEPTTLRPPGNAPPGPSGSLGIAGAAPEPGNSPLRTDVSGGATNSNWRSSGVSKPTWVKPTSNAGAVRLVE